MFLQENYFSSSKTWSGKHNWSLRKGSPSREYSSGREGAAEDPGKKAGDLISEQRAGWEKSLWLRTLLGPIGVHATWRDTLAPCIVSESPI